MDRSMMSRKSYKKQGSFLLNKSPSMELALPDHQRPNNIPDHYSINKPTDLIPPSKPYYYNSVQVPIHHNHPIIQPSAGQDEMHHFSHPQHPLAKVSSPYLFTCLGCKEYGAGTAVSCQFCGDFQLHEFCALASPTLNSHPLHSQHQLVFRSKPAKGGILWPRCDICNKAIKGFSYRCSSCSFMMHPCCAQLSTEMNISVHPHCLKLLLPASSGGGGDPGLACAHCEKKRSGRVYRCTTCDYHLHAFCAKSLVNGLHENGIEAPEKGSMLGTAAKIASHVVVGFIGGLFEGIGEGVGEVLIQSIAKARRWNSRSE